MRWNDSAPAAGFSIHAPWEALSDDPSSLNVATEQADPGSLWSLYRHLIELRASHPAIATGTWTGITSEAPGLVAALRVSPTETAVTLTNVSADAVSPNLSLEAGPLCGSPSVEVIDGSSREGSAPTFDARGGFTGWRPVASISGHSSIVIVLGRPG
jgi:glycosidase